ncbi:MAG: single-stranded DNA-binding protein [Oscillospiraceae bacterium]|nr:single-stranded DNA-binding protein [Oscillospiraceae bacterium]
MEWEWKENQVFLRGTAEETPYISHESYGQIYVKFFLSVARLSGIEDRLPILCKQEQSAQIAAGQQLEITGELRSFNNKNGSGQRLILSVFAKSVQKTAGEPQNTLFLDGVVCKAPTFRQTPLGREICDFILAVNRRYGRADYLPCIAWGRLAKEIAVLPVGSRLCLDGRLQSRTYRKMIGEYAEERTAFEVSVMRLCPLERDGSKPLVFQRETGG